MNRKLNVLYVYNTHTHTHTHTHTYVLLSTNLWTEVYSEYRKNLTILFDKPIIIFLDWLITNV